VVLPLPIVCSVHSQTCCVVLAGVSVQQQTAFLSTKTGKSKIVTVVAVEAGDVHFQGSDGLPAGDSCADIPEPLRKRLLP